MLSSSAENYLKSIFILHDKNGAVKSKDIAEHLGYSKSSVSASIKKLSMDGYVAVSFNGFITLTDKGINAAEKLCEKHKLIKDLLIKAGVSEGVANRDACLIEHDISDESFGKLKELYRRL